MNNNVNMYAHNIQPEFCAVLRKPCLLLGSDPPILPASRQNHTGALWRTMPLSALTTTHPESITDDWFVPAKV